MAVKIKYPDGTVERIDEVVDAEKKDNVVEFYDRDRNIVKRINLAEMDSMEMLQWTIY